MIQQIAQSLLLGCCAMVFAATLSAQNSPIGVWKTIDDKTGEAKSHVEIYEKAGVFYGKVVKLLRKDAAGRVCDLCSGSRKDQPIMGMVILENLKPYKDYWRKGNIIDPETGNEYGCTIWFEAGKPNELQVKGIHWTGLYRTQTWYRVP